MERVRIVCAVAKDEAVTSSLLQNELAFVRVGLSIYQPGVELTRTTRDLFENHFDGLVRRNRIFADFAEDGVVPRSLGGHHPLGLTVLVFVFHDDTQPSVANSLLRGAQDPYPRL